MAQYVKGDIVLTPFPFSDDEEFKVRPALILAALPYGSGTDYLVCIITTQSATARICFLSPTLTSTVAASAKTATCAPATSTPSASSASSAASAH